MPKPFTKGDPRINRKGRPPGKPNKTTDELRDLVRSFLVEKLPEIKNIWARLEPKEKMQAFDRLLKHTLPAPQDELMRLSDQQLDEIIDRLKKRQLDNCWDNEDISN